MLIVPAPGGRPSDQTFPIMLWGEDEAVEDINGDDDDVSEYSDSEDSFAVDYVEEFAKKSDASTDDEELSVTEVSFTKCQEDDVSDLHENPLENFSVKRVDV
jgi:hypothetical protein